MKQTPKYHIKYPAATDLVKDASSQFKQMAESIDANIDTLPAQVSQLVTSSAQAAQDAQRKAEAAAATTGKLADQNMADNIMQSGSRTRAALGQWHDEATSPLLVTFGDSYASNPASSWAVELQRLIPGSTLKNFAVGGAGFGIDTRTFQAQLDKAKADAAISQAGTNAIIVLAGGRNDILSETDARTMASSWANNARAAWPNARIICVPLLFDDDPTSATDRVKYSGLIHGFQQTGAVEIVSLAYLWLKGEGGLIQSDGIHPNQAGCKVIAGQVLNAINGTYSPRSEYTLRQFGSAPIECTLSGATVSLNWQGSVPSIGGGSSNSLPGWAKPAINQWAVGASGGNGSRRTLYLATIDPALKIYQASTDDQGYCCGSITYPA